MIYYQLKPEFDGYVLHSEKTSKGLNVVYGDANVMFTEKEKAVFNACEDCYFEKVELPRQSVVRVFGGRYEVTAAVPRTAPNFVGRCVFERCANTSYYWHNDEHCIELRRVDSTEYIVTVARVLDLTEETHAKEIIKQIGVDEQLSTLCVDKNDAINYIRFLLTYRL